MTDGTPSQSLGLCIVVQINGEKPSTKGESFEVLPFPASLTLSYPQKAGSHLFSATYLFLTGTGTSGQ